MAHPQYSSFGFNIFQKSPFTEPLFLGAHEESSKGGIKSEYSPMPEG